MTVGEPGSAVTETDPPYSNRRRLVEPIAVELAVIFFLILANGFFSGSELAIISARKSTISRLVAEGNSRAMVVEKLQNDPHRFLATVQIGVTVVGGLASGG
jgi:putative hemolysin